jgi:hypothetical protein
MRSDSVSSADVASSNSSTVGSFSIARAIACVIGVCVCVCACVCSAVQGQVKRAHVHQACGMLQHTAELLRTH